MNDDELKARLAEAHRDDAAPPFAAILGRARRRRPRWALGLVPLAAAVVLVLLLLRPHAPPATMKIELKDPLAFLLVPPGGDVLSTVPQFDTGGDLP